MEASLLVLNRVHPRHTPPEDSAIDLLDERFQLEVEDARNNISFSVNTRNEGPHAAGPHATKGTRPIKHPQPARPRAPGAGEGSKPSRRRHFAFFIAESSPSPNMMIVQKCSSSLVLKRRASSRASPCGGARAGTRAGAGARAGGRAGSNGGLSCCSGARGVVASSSLSSSSGLASLSSVYEAQQFDRQMLDELFEVAQVMENVQPNTELSTCLQGKVMATLFYEPSTRTRLSFESAMSKLGGAVVSTENAREFSSAAKGETLEDSIRTVSGYADVIVLRHFVEGSARRAALVNAAPVLNAGDGPGQHPTQALLDVYTIGKERRQHGLGIDGATVALVGDLANGRTARSLATMLARNYENMHLIFVAPDVVRMGDDIKAYVDEQPGCTWEESTDLNEVASRCDVLYMTRVQKERFESPSDYELAKGKYIVDASIMDLLPSHAVVMHPLPRLDEIAAAVDDDPRCAYFRQAKNGLHIRMALLKVLLLQ